MKTTALTRTILLALALLTAVSARAQVPQILSYQGRVTASGTNFAGTGQFKFALVNTAGTANYWANDGTAAGEPVTAVALTVTSGLVSVLLGDTTLAGMTTAIAPDVFANTDVRLRIWFTDGNSAFQQLTPDQRLAAVGYALVAATVPAANLSGTLTAAQVPSLDASKIASGSFTAAQIPNLDGAKITSGTVADARLSANIALLNGANTFSGANTLNNAANTFAGTFTGNGAALTGVTATIGAASVGTTALVDGSVTTAKIAANAVGSSQLANSAVSSAQLDLTGLATTLWKVGGNSGTIPAFHYLGTSDNQPLHLHANGTRALRLEPNSSAAPNVIGGAAVNSVSSGAVGATIAGGGAGSFGGTAITNLVQSSFSTIGGGGANGIKTSSPGSTIAGGYLNVVSNNASYATVGGGYANGVGTNSATVAGGYFNLASGFESTIAGGEANSASGSVSFIGGGVSNLTSGFEATVAGGEQNYASGAISFVGGGFFNGASAYGAVASGGYDNLASATNATVAGGALNLASGVVSTVGGGYYNGATGYGATIPGGYANSATGSVSFAAGYFANAAHAGAFVWSDVSSTNVFSSTLTNQFNVRAYGGTRFITGASLGVPTGVSLAPGGGSFISLSDRNAKENFSEVNSREVLEKVAALPLTTWNYRAQDHAIRHIGPMAQDFHAAFHVGESELGITGTDADGVALAAIQGLYRIVKEKNEKISDLERRLTDLESRLQKPAK